MYAITLLDLFQFTTIKCLPFIQANDENYQEDKLKS